MKRHRPASADNDLVTHLLQATDDCGLELVGALALNLLLQLVHLLADDAVSCEFLRHLLARFRGFALDILNGTSARTDSRLDLLSCLFHCSCYDFDTSCNIRDSFPSDKQDIGEDEAEGGRCSEDIGEGVRGSEEGSCIGSHLFL